MMKNMMMVMMISMVMAMMVTMMMTMMMTRVLTMMITMVTMVIIMMTSILMTERSGKPGCEGTFFPKPFFAPQTPSSLSQPSKSAAPRAVSPFLVLNQRIYL